MKGAPFFVHSLEEQRMPTRHKKLKRAVERINYFANRGHNDIDFEFQLRAGISRHLLIHGVVTTVQLETQMEEIERQEREIR